MFGDAFVIIALFYAKIEKNLVHSFAKLWACINVSMNLDCHSILRSVWLGLLFSSWFTG